MSDAHMNHVIGGYKATLSNDRTSDEAKEHAQEKLEELQSGSNYDQEGTNKSYSSDFSEEEKHNHHVEGGLKGALKNPNVSEEKKEEIKERLESDF